ncbi:4-alpha-glucanotransferase [Oscillospiraceae bacterium NSJ-54]|uniref:4-alpha-glucanotransferase n=2 Tax=Zongyangia hominis TaxID=2763677 RepID=A0A926ECB9_9FIRM|nr:4-alpha-glucanotransferase [Zongyangia hominis]
MTVKVKVKPAGPIRDKERRAGILLHITSLPSNHGIGTLGKEAYRFVDFLKRSGIACWQLLPLGPTGFGDSPYQSFSTFAGNPYLIDLDLLVEEGLLREEDIDDSLLVGDPRFVDFKAQFDHRFALLRRAYERGREAYAGEVAAFQKENSRWLDDYALFMAGKKKFHNAPWQMWEQGVKLREPASLEAFRQEMKDETDFVVFTQYLFYKQYKDLKIYANRQGIFLIGDIPIYVAQDSADVWSHPELFLLDEQRNPILCAGVPPDLFSADGQLWGNPLYRWKVHKESGYRWWMERIRAVFERCDIVRIDHFRAFHDYWAVPYGNKTARCGRWMRGPGIGFFEALRRTLGEKPIIAEDLGALSAGVGELLAASGFPGMKVLQFAFSPEERSAYLPHHHKKNAVVYTGTHDNETLCGFFIHAPDKVKAFAGAYLGCEPQVEVLTWETVRACFASVADLAVIQLQDVLLLGDWARMNEPSTVGKNWQWRMNKGILTDELSEHLRALCKIYER